MDEWDDVRRLAPEPDSDEEIVAVAREALVREIRTAGAVEASVQARDRHVVRPRGRRRHVRAIVGSALAVILVGAVVGAVVWTRSVREPDHAPVAAEQSEPGLDRSAYLCGSARVPAAALESPEPVDLTDPELKAAVDGAIASIDSAIWGMGTEMLANPGEWIVVRPDSDRLLLREARVPEEEAEYIARGELPVRDHDAIELARVDGAWTFRSSGGCALELQLDGLELAGVAIDPGVPLDPDSTTLHLLVQEWECTSGRGAEGRIELVGLDQDAESIGLVIGLTPLVPREGIDTTEGGLVAYNCVGTAPVPYTVELDAPLGTRAVRDLGYAQPRRLTL